MGLDHSNAFVRLIFDGLIGFCFCRRGDYDCQMGMVQAPDHTRRLNDAKPASASPSEQVSTSKPAPAS